MGSCGALPPASFGRQARSSRDRQVNITSRQLHAFILTARHECFSRAAEEMFITQSGISTMVRELESQLGFRLFERTTRKVRLTDLGARFLPVANRCLRELEDAALHTGRRARVAGPHPPS